MKLILLYIQPKPKHFRPDLAIPLFLNISFKFSVLLTSVNFRVCEKCKTSIFDDQFKYSMMVT